MIYEIHPCTAAEKEELKRFIDRHWKEKHVLAVSDALLDFQHRNTDGSYNFLIARNTVSDQIDGVFGYIPSAQFDPALSANGDYFGAVWKVRDDVFNEDIKLLGVLLWKHMCKLPGFEAYFTVGISDIAEQFYRMARLSVDYLRQYYILNESIKNFRIAVIPEGVGSRNQSGIGEIRIGPVRLSEADRIRHPYYPRKSLAFLQNRYARHPYYRYVFRGVYLSGVLQAVWVTRTVEAQGSRCLRIVDIYGGIEQLPSAYGAVQQLLRDENAEYIDCMNYGIDPEVFRRIGFSELDPDSKDTIVPNYFEPFVKRNVRLECVHTPGKAFVIFKGDGDQDRPNIIPSI